MEESGIFPPTVLPGTEAGNVTAIDALPARPEPKPVTTTQTVAVNGHTVTTITDAAGNTTVITTNGDRMFSSAVTTTTDDDGNTITTTIDASNKTTVVVTDANGAVVGPGAKAGAPDGVSESPDAPVTTAALGTDASAMSGEPTEDATTVAAADDGVKRRP